MAGSVMREISWTLQSNTRSTPALSPTSMADATDPCGTVLFLFYYLAVGTLLPWNFFINVNGYWMYKFRTVNGSDATISEITAKEPEKNDLQLQFTSELAIAAMVPNVSFLILNGLFGHRFKTTPRLLCSLCVVVALFIFTLVLVRTNTDNWQLEFLTITLATVIVINVFTAIFQGGLLGLAGCFPSRYMNAVLTGQVK